MIPMKDMNYIIGTGTEKTTLKIIFSGSANLAIKKRIIIWDGAKDLIMAESPS